MYDVRKKYEKEGFKKEPEHGNMALKNLKKEMKGKVAGKMKQKLPHASYKGSHCPSCGIRMTASEANASGHHHMDD